MEGAHTYRFLFVLWVIELAGTRICFGNLTFPPIVDDLEVSPDFFAYMNAMAPVLRREPKLWCVSAWSDNGFESTATDEGLYFLHILFVY